MAPISRWKTKVNPLKLLRRKSDTVLRLQEKLTVVEKELERAREKETLLAQLLESSSQPFVISYGSGGLALCNQAFCHLTGYSKDELASISWSEDLTPIEWREREGEYLNQINLTGQPLRYEKEYIHKDGHRIPIEVFVHQVSDEHGQPVYYYGFATDITERKQMISELEKHRHHLAELVEERTNDMANILESISDAFFSLDFNWRINYWNQGTERLTSIARKDALGQKFWDRFPAMMHSELYTQLRRAMTDRVAVQFETQSPHHKKWLDVHIYPSRSGVSVFYRDISERKQAEDELRASEERFRRVFDTSASLMSIIALPEGRYIDVNRSWLAATGLKREDVVGHLAHDIGLWSGDHIARLAGELLSRGSIQNRELQYQDQAGNTHIGLFSTERTTIDGQPCVISMINDITELRRLEQEMARLTGLELAGRMAASIGHEIRNPMTTVRGFLQFLGYKENYAEDKEYFDLMIDELDRANAIITEFLTLAKSRPELAKLSDLRQEVLELMPLIKADALLRGHNVELQLDKTPEIMLDSKDIRQLILNLVRNGFEAMDTGMLTISTYCTDSKVALAIKDQGQGIPAQVLEKLGTPFFTTKESGTGLGLAVCYRIAANHGAKIEVDTGPEGTTFTVVFNIPTLSS